MPVVAYSNCSTTEYTVTAFADIPVHLNQKTFQLAHGTKSIEARIAPGAVEPGLYTVHLLMESKQDIAREEFVVKITEAEDPLLIAETPAVMNIAENQEFDVAIAIENKGDVVLNNVVVFIDEEGETRKFSHELESLQPNEKKYVNFHYDARVRGEYTLNYTVASGEYLFKGQITVGSSSQNYPFLTTLTVRGYNEGYVLNYYVKNIGPKRMNNLFLTIEDAPTDWDVISPSVFTLAPGETKELELVTTYGKTVDATVHVALYESQTLRAENKVEFSQARLRGTGLISFADSFEIGLILMLTLLVAFFGLKLYRKTKQKNIDIRSLIPDWFESLWPF